MGTLTGSLRDFGIDALGTTARIIITPTEAAISLSSNRLLTPKPIVVEPDGAGDFSVFLNPSAYAQPVVFYQLRVVALTGESMPYFDAPRWKLYMPEGDVALSALGGVPANPAWWWAGPDAPDSPVAHAGWLDSDTGLYYEWE